MTRQSIDELVVGAARGEPMDVDERERLADALASSPQLEERLRAQRALTAELAALKAAVQPPPASRADEERLRVAFRAAAARRRGAARPLFRPWSLAASMAAAAAVVIVVASLERPPPGRGSAETATASRSEEATRAAAPAGELAERGSGAAAGGGASPAGAAPAVFYPLPYAPRLSTAGSYSLVRVRIPLASFTAGDGGQVLATVEADVLIGDDGIPSAIRFTDHGTLLVSTNSD